MVNSVKAVTLFDNLKLPPYLLSSQISAKLTLAFSFSLKISLAETSKP